MTLANETETTAQAGQSVELRQGARNDQIIVFVHQRSDVGGIRRDEAGISLVDEYHRVGGDVFHDAANLVGRQAVTRRIVGRSKQQHAGMHAVSVFDDLVDIVGEGILLLVQGVHLEYAVALAGYTVVVPP